MFTFVVWCVLPTCVGMVRSWLEGERRGSCSPHVRGDGPNTELSAFD